MYILCNMKGSIVYVLYAVWLQVGWGGAVTTALEGVICLEEKWLASRIFVWLVNNIR
jgi:hypothetical protein